MSLWAAVLLFVVYPILWVVVFTFLMWWTTR